MVNINTIGGQTNSRDILEIYGLSTDDKPIVEFQGCKIGNSSVYITMDTHEVFFYDQENHRWLKQ